MMSFDQLLVNTARFEPDHKNAKYVGILKVQRVTPNIYKISTLTRIPSGTPGYSKGHVATHTVVLEDLSGLEFTNSKSPIQVSCDCDRFKYMWEWALHRQGAAQIIHSNGAAAKITNPRGIPCGCKHIFLVLLHIKRLMKSKKATPKKKLN